MLFHEERFIPKGCRMRGIGRRGKRIVPEDNPHDVEENHFYHFHLVTVFFPQVRYPMLPVRELKKPTG
jgi:hypothetical protein